MDGHKNHNRPAGARNQEQEQEQWRNQEHDQRHWPCDFTTEMPQQLPAGRGSRRTLAAHVENSNLCQAGAKTFKISLLLL